MSSSQCSIVPISSFRCVIPTVIVAVLLAGAAGAGLFFLLYYILFLMSGLSINFQRPSSFHFNSSLLSLDSDAHRLLSVLSRFAGWTFIEQALSSKMHKCKGFLKPTSWLVMHSACSFFYVYSPTLNSKTRVVHVLSHFPYGFLANTFIPIVFWLYLT